MKVGDDVANEIYIDRERNMSRKKKREKGRGEKEEVEDT